MTRTNVPKGWNLPTVNRYNRMEVVSTRKSTPNKRLIKRQEGVRRRSVRFALPMATTFPRIWLAETGGSILISLSPFVINPIRLPFFVVHNTLWVRYMPSFLKVMMSPMARVPGAHFSSRIESPCLIKGCMLFPVTLSVIVFPLPSCSRIK